ncbi:transglycosylase SLT domain-containing protein [Ottowia thiooxydans]|uniref:lytic transglycosylase domain-containing protein n=1 Tax=Ottowia thiooxydans TaxID=219182 RepID=UPI000684EC8B
MYFPKILTSFIRLLVLPACGVLLPGLLAAQGARPGAPQSASAPGSDGIILDMREAARRGDKARLAALLPLARGHALEPWAAYWEMKARLDEANVLDVQDFLSRYAGSYQEDRLRNDWLLLAGKRRDWAGFSAEWPRFRMRDDREARCYAAAMEVAQGRAVTAEVVADVRRDWFAQRELDDGCLLAAGLLHQAGKLPFNDLWLKARLAMEANRPGMARAAVELDAPDAAATVAQIQTSPIRYLTSRAAVGTRKGQELIVLALIKLATQDPDQAAAQMESKWSVQLRPEERNWVWGVIGRQAALKLQDGAVQIFAKVTRDKDLSDEMLAWKARSAMRQGQWRTVKSAIEAMDASAREEPVWVYWRARALTALARSDADRVLPRQLLESIAGVQGFYEKLAQEDLGRLISVPPAPAPLTEAEKAAARSNAGLNRALLAISVGLRSEGVREWNYTTNLHTPGGMPERELHAAADLACQFQVWDRCINTSERTRTSFDYGHRFPMPFRDAVVNQSRSIGLDPAYVYGLIRQESRFIIAARSGVGASGLMQVMPATARWTARKIGLTGFTPDQIYQQDTNILLGTSYLKLALDDFQNSLPLAAAAYNAGPGRPRLWRAPGGSNPTLDGAIWAENVPFSETRDYVKKVLSNTVDYAAILTGQPQSLKARLGTVGPLPTGAVDLSTELVPP